MFKAWKCISTYSELCYLALCSKKCSLFCFCFIDHCGWSLEDHFILKCCSSYFFFFSCETCSLNGFIVSNIIAYPDVWQKKVSSMALGFINHFNAKATCNKNVLILCVFVEFVFIWKKNHWIRYLFFRWLFIL